MKALIFMILMYGSGIIGMVSMMIGFGLSIPILAIVGVCFAIAPIGIVLLVHPSVE